MGAIALRRESFTELRRIAEEAIDMALDSGLRWAMVEWTFVIAARAAAQEPVRAVALWAAGEANLPAVMGEGSTIIRTVRPTLEDLRGRFDDPSFSDAWQRGATLELIDAAREARRLALVT